jgi:uncharacterized protein
MILDAHAYIGQGVHLRSSVKDLLSTMDEGGVQKAIICTVDKYLAVENTAGNNEILTAQEQYPDRFLGLACANPWFGKKAEEELERALKAGLAGLFIHPGYQGIRLDDPLVFPLLEIVEKYQGTVYLHTGTAVIAEPFQAVMLAERYPLINFLMGHGGSPDYGEDAVSALNLVDNLWLESSRNGPANFNFWKVRGKQNRVVFGSSYPEYYPITEIETLKDVFVDEDERTAAFSSTLISIFRGRL